MGAKIAYEVAKELEKEKVIPKLLIVSGSRPPYMKEPNPIYHLSDRDFKAGLGRFEGTPKEIMENEELLDFFLPMLRADFTMDETYQVKELKKLECPLIALGGLRDHEADEEMIRGWSGFTKGNFESRMFSGGHFLYEKAKKRFSGISKIKLRNIIMAQIRVFYESDRNQRFSLRPEEVHLWLIRWRKIENWIANHWSLLEKPEDRYVEKFKSQEDRFRSAAGKIMTRLLASRYLHIPWIVFLSG